MKKSKRLFLLVTAAAMVLSVLLVTSCQKEEVIPPIDKDGFGTVEFRPQMYGEVVPWLKNSALKSFADFELKWTEMVLRIYTDALVWQMDIPVNIGNGTYSVSLPFGDYVVDAIPVKEDAATMIAGGVGGPYTPIALDTLTRLYSMDRAAAYTTSSVAFTVSAISGIVAVPVVTDFSCIQLDLYDGSTYAAAGVPEPSVLATNRGTFIGARSVAGTEASTYTELATLVSGGYAVSFQDANTVRLTPTGEIDILSFEFDDFADIYYLYTLPAQDGAITMTWPVGDGTYTAPVDNWQNVHYFGFDFEGATGGSYPTVWCKDGLNASATFLSNMTLRITMTAEQGFSLSEQTWFDTIIDGGTH